MKKLPYPRMELRWRKTAKSKDGDSADNCQWACDYLLVMYPKTVGDLRSNKNDKAAAQDVSFLLNTTYRNSVMEPYAGDTPFRDGVHAMWDSHTLNLPAYSIYKGKSKKIEVNPNAMGTVHERLPHIKPR